MHKNKFDLATPNQTWLGVFSFHIHLVGIGLDPLGKLGDSQFPSSTSFEAKRHHFSNGSTHVVEDVLLNMKVFSNILGSLKYLGSP